jgi:ABC-2 type transport system ATP-binding protein
MIEAHNLSKAYGGRTVVSDLSFQIRPGVVTGFLGPNGAGKSTTIRMMLGLDNGGGETLFDGVPYRRLKNPMFEVGTLLDVKAFHPTRRARQHLLMVGASHGIGRKRVDEVLEWVGLAAVARKRPRGYSLGMAQRLGLAAALLGDPRTLILDEPANGLDPAGITWLRGFLRAYAAQGHTVFVSSHQLAEMSMMADHLIVIGQGRLIADEPTAAFTARSSKAGTVAVRTPHLERLSRVLVERGARVVREDGNVLAVSGMGRPEIGECAFRHGIVLHELTSRTPALEDAFLELTGGAEEFRGRIPGQGTARAEETIDRLEAAFAGADDEPTETFRLADAFARAEGEGR